MIKGVLFDLDGTLLDRDKSLIAFLESQYIRLPELQAIEKNTFIQRFVQLDQKGYVWKDVVYQQLIEEYALDLCWDNLLEDYIEAFQYHCVGFPGLMETLDLLKEMNLKLGIISNGFGQFQMNNIKGLNIAHYFDAILISEMEGLRKPSIDIFHRAINRLNLQPYETIFVGDHPVNDVEASVAAGMKGIWIEDPYFNKPSGDHIAIKTLSELQDIVSKLSR